MSLNTPDIERLIDLYWDSDNPLTLAPDEAKDVMDCVEMMRLQGWDSLMWMGTDGAETVKAMVEWKRSQ